ncbi:MAG: replicative DNA helicase [Geminicoccaceae bacterium]
MAEIHPLANYAPGQPAAANPPIRTQPHNLDAEQALLGAILVNNETYHRVADFLRAEHFYEPVHTKIFECVAQRIARGQLADPVTLKTLFEDDPAFAELGGGRYLLSLARAAETIINAVEYADLVHDLAVRRGLIAVGQDIVNRAFDPAAEARGSDQIEQAERELFQLAQQGEVKGEFRKFPDVLTSTVEMIQIAYRKAGRVTGVPSGLAALDEKLGGMQRSDLIILAGRPSMGKTALAITMAANAAASKVDASERQHLKHDNYVVGVFSLEMSAEQLTTRLLSASAEISSDLLRRGAIEDGDWPRVVRASQELANLPLFIDDTPALSVAALRTRARRLKRTHGLSLLVVDYLQLLRGVGKHSEQNRVQEVSEITQTLKAIAKELNVPVLALSQLSRAVEAREDKRPMLSDLRESGSIEQDADVVMFVYRDEYYLSRAEPKQRPDQKADRYQEEYLQWKSQLEAAHNKAEVIVAKQRNGPIGKVEVQFDAGYGRFRNLEHGGYGGDYP